MTIEPASEASVAFALGRLATVGGNLDIARSHAGEVVALAPSSPAGYELLAYAAHETGDEETLASALDGAIARGSNESWIYVTKADNLLVDSQRSKGPLDELIPPAVAREAATLYERSLGMRPRNRDAFAGLVTALLNVDDVTNSDEVALGAGRILYATDGLLLVGQAAVEKTRGNAAAAVELLGQAMAEPYTMPRRFRNSVAALRADWFGDWFIAEVATLTDAGRFDESRELIARHLADETIKGPLRSLLEEVQSDLPALERLHAATEAGRAGKTAEAAAMLTALVNDPSTGERARREAERLLKLRAAP
jgi:hypothetical protein